MTVVDDVLREFREFRRYTGDGLPGEPTNAPLPVGDPQSGPWNPKKANLRLALGNLAQQLLDGIALLNGMVPAITAARDQALSAIATSRTSALSAIDAARIQALADVGDLVEEGEAARDVTLAARDVAVTKAGESEVSAQNARNAAEASGSVVFFDTKALADAAVAGLPANQIVEVFNDEAVGGARTRYRKEAGALVFKTIAGLDVDDLYSPSIPQSQPAKIRDVMERGIVTPAMFASSVLEPLGDYWLADGSVNPAPRDNYEALQKALDSGRPLYLPKYRKRTGYYSSQKLVVQPGTKIRGDGTMGHTTIADGTVAIVSANGEEILNLRQNNAQRSTFEGFTLFCPDKSTRGIDVTPLRTTMRDIFILGASDGIGGVAGVFGEHSNLFNVHVYGCGNIGVQRIRDTRWYGGRIAACKGDGMLLGPGASDNMLFLKIDFNEGWGLNINDAEDIQIFGEGFDRNYKGGIRINSARRISGIVNLARNGRNDSGTFGEDTSLYIGGVCDGITLTAVTSTGVDDNGSGTLTPRYGLHVDGGSHQNINIFGDLSKATNAPLRLTNGASLDQLNIQASGVPTKSVKEPTQFSGAVTAKNGLAVTGNASVSGVVAFQSKSTGNLANGASANITFSLPPIPASSRKVYQLRLCARKSNSFADSPSAIFSFVVKRDSADAAVELSTPFGAVDAGDTFFALTGTPNVLLVPSINADGSTMILACTSAFAGGQVNIFADLV